MKSAQADASQPLTVDNAEIPLSRDVFVRRLLRGLSGTLEEVVGLEEAAGFVSIVGQYMADWLHHEYKNALQVPRLREEQIADVLVDLKRRIEGDFYIIEETLDKIVLGNRKCPFSNDVVGRPSLCAMTSTVFGTIAAETAGYAKVDIVNAIAKGDPGCKVVVYLNESEAAKEKGVEFFPAADNAAPATDSSR